MLSCAYWIPSTPMTNLLKGTNQTNKKKAICYKKALVIDQASIKWLYFISGRCMINYSYLNLHHS